MTPQLETIHRIMREIQAVYQENPNLHLVVGHGSGSFGHSVGKQYGTRDGVRTYPEWQGFHQVYQAARQLNQIVYTAAIENGLPVIPFSLCSNATIEDRNISSWNLHPMIEALSKRFIPIVYGDVAFDTTLGGTILSTEEIFGFLSNSLKPDKILIAGVEPGVWADYPDNTRILPRLHLTDWDSSQINVLGSGSVDVTGGMKTKVESMFAILRENPACEITLFSGLEPGVFRDILCGKAMGTTIQA